MRGTGEKGKEKKKREPFTSVDRGEEERLRRLGVSTPRFVCSQSKATQHGWLAVYEREVDRLSKGSRPPQRWAETRQSQSREQERGWEERQERERNDDQHTDGKLASCWFKTPSQNAPTLETR